MGTNYVRLQQGGHAITDGATAVWQHIEHPLPQFQRDVLRGLTHLIEGREIKQQLGGLPIT